MRRSCGNGHLEEGRVHAEDEGGALLQEGVGAEGEPHGRCHRTEERSILLVAESSLNRLLPRLERRVEWAVWQRCRRRVSLEEEVGKSLHVDGDVRPGEPLEDLGAAKEGVVEDGQGEGGGRFRSGQGPSDVSYLHGSNAS